MSDNIIELDNNTIGINGKEVKKYTDLLNECVDEENKIEGLMRNINERLKNAYRSNNSDLIYKNNVSIANSLHTKARNIRSYKLYAEKFITSYASADIDAQNEAAALVEKLD